MEGQGCDTHGPYFGEPVIWNFVIDGCHEGSEAELVEDKHELKALQAQHYILGRTQKLTQSLTGLLRKQ